MWNMIYPVLIVICANTIYHTSSKSTPTDINPFASLVLSYVVAAAISLICFFVTSGQRNLFAEFGKANWATLTLAAALVFLEFGYICVYRAGWKISMASLVANLSVACILLILGLLLFKETITPRQFLGIAVCGAGLFLIKG